MEFSIVFDASAFKKSIDRTAEQYDAAFKVAANMIASMMEERIEQDIRSAGNFGDQYLEGLDVDVDEDNTISVTIDAPNAAIFEDGGRIEGNPLLWLPISGTDAEGIQASDYGGQLFSVNRRAGGVPLLFSVKDRAPKYFGVPSVNIPKKFHITEIITKTMVEDFPAVLKGALNE